MKRQEEQGKGKVKACGQEGKHQVLLDKVEEDGIVQVKHIVLKNSSGMWQQSGKILVRLVGV